MFYVLKPTHSSILFSQGEIVRRDGAELVSVSDPTRRGVYTDDYLPLHFDPLSREKLLWLEKTLSEQLRACADALQHKPGDFKTGDKVYRNNGNHKVEPYTVLAINPTRCWLMRFGGDDLKSYDAPEFLNSVPRTGFILKD